MIIRLTKYALGCALAATAWATAVGQSLPSQLFGQHDRGAMERWADSVYQSLGTEERLAQLIMPIVYPSREGARIATEEARVRQYRWGGILYQRGMLADQAQMNSRLQRASRVPMLIALDGEWGLYMRLKDAPRYPRNMGLGLHGDEQLLYNYGREIARQCRLMGIHINFAPTVDVNINPQNPVIGTRSFGADAKDVARLSLAYAQGLEDGGVLSVAKHFPGHGDTSEDSHKTLPLVSATRRRMQGVELYPFAQYIKAGMGGIMTAHLRVPAYESEPIPSSLSRKITTDLLQREMRFGGLIFTDGLEMKGVHASKVGDVGVAALRAGNDILLGPPSPEAQLRALSTALADGRLDAEEVRHKVMKVLYYKWRLIVQGGDSPAPPSEVKALIHTADTERQMRQLWRASLHFLQRDAQVEKALEAGRYRRIAVVQVGKNPVGEVARPSRGAGGSQIAYLTAESLGAGAKALEAYDLILVNAFQTSGIPSEALVRLARSRPVLVAYYTSPYRVKPMAWHSQLSHVIVAIEAAREAQEAVLSLIVGELAPSRPSPAPTAPDADDPTAQMTPAPEDVPQAEVEQVPRKPKPSFSLIKRLDPKALRHIESIVGEGIRQGAFPGCQVYVLHRGQEAYARAFGTMTRMVENEPVSLETIYDVASITKALAMTPAMMLLVADGKVRLEASISTYLPELRGTPVGRSSIKSLLLHQSGLPAGLNFYTDLIDTTSYEGALIRYRAFEGGVRLVGAAWGNPRFAWLPEYISTERDARHSATMARGLYISPAFRQVMMTRIGEAPLTRIGQYRYSDLGFILLQQVAERVSGEALDALLERRVFTPIGAKVYYRPLERGVALERIAPTQLDSFLRKQVVRGTVDDESAACLGGVSGNAGLYASAPELAKVAQLLLDGGRWGDKQIIPQAVVQEFMTTTGVRGYRALGFDKPRRTGVNPAADSASPATVGHFGFTGTAFWIDPQEQLVFVFLSNRTYPSRHNNKLSTDKYRPRLHQAVYDALR